MEPSIFKNFTGLDTDYLDAAYGDDAETAALVFDQYLQDLPGNLELLDRDLADRDIENFKLHIHKQKPGYSYVGLTDITAKFHELQTRCLTREDLGHFEPEIRQAMQRIRSSADIIRTALVQLQAG